MSLTIIILAAGEGRRLNSSTPKPLLPLAGTPMLGHLLKTVQSIKAAQVIVVVPKNATVSDYVKKQLPQAQCVIQAQANGTAAAVDCAIKASRVKNSTTLILCADAPLITAAKMRQLIRQAKNGVAGVSSVALLSFITDTPSGYGRIVSDTNQQVSAIIEHRDANAAQRNITQVYAGIMAVPTPLLKKLLSRIGNNNAAAEKYLTDIAALATRQGTAVRAICAPASECYGVNTMADLAQLERTYQRQMADNLMKKGVQLMDPARLDICGTVTIKGKDIRIDANVVLQGNITLAANTHIGVNCVIRDCRIGENTTIAPFSHLDGATIGKNCRIGPYARLRPQTQLHNNIHIGNFVEVKKSTLHNHVKASHLSYLGDATIGQRTNVGAGTITCNYDGKTKHRTIIDDDVFIGSDTQLIAPLKIGKGVLIGAGSTITKNIPEKVLAVSRHPQKHHPLKDKK